MHTNKKSLGFRAGATCGSNDQQMTGLGLFSVGLEDGGNPVFRSGANIWISSIDVVASGPGNLTASGFQGFVDSEGDATSVVTPIKFTGKSKSEQVKLQLSKSKKVSPGARRKSPGSRWLHRRARALRAP
jgi:hypothetical protein